jgi:hypothetical protein
VIPSPPKEVSEEIRNAFITTYVDLESLYLGDDPFTRPN